MTADLSFFKIIILARYVPAFLRKRPMKNNNRPLRGPFCPFEVRNSKNDKEHKRA